MKVLGSGVGLVAFKASYVDDLQGKSPKSLFLLLWSVPSFDLLS